MADAEQSLRAFVEKVLDGQNYKPRQIKIEPISSGGANFTTSIFLVKVTSPKKDDLNLFAKVAIIVDEEMRKKMNTEWLYDTERFVYTKLTKIYNEIEEEYNVPKEHRYIFPKCYGCNAERTKEIVVMENLIQSGYTSYSRFKSMDWEHASKVVENLAKFHALSFAFAKYRPEEFQKSTADMKYKIGGDENDEVDLTSQQLLEKMVNGSLDLIKEEQRNAVRSFVYNNIYLKRFNRIIGQPVLAHGDYRMSNILFKEEDNLLQPIAVDYQTVHAGNVAADLIYFIFLGSDREFRKQHFEELLDHYYKALSQALKRLSMYIVEVYPRNKFDSDIKEILPYALLLGVLVLPVVTVEAGDAPNLANGVNPEDFVIKANDLYSKRLTELVDDMFEMGAIKNE